MKLIVDIPDSVYATVEKWDDVTLNWAERLIKYGTPLPKGHGDLKDVEKLKHAFVMWSRAFQGNFTDADIASIIYNSPTIIDADKESK